jgi:hypothetical protein
MVLGGFSQGAAVMGFVTANTVPDGVSASDVPPPMPPDVANHVAAVALFGKPSTRFMHAINDPPVTIGPQYVGKTVDLCVDNDLVCDSHGTSFSAHNQYTDTGMVDQGATFVANQLQASWTADALAPPPAGGVAPAPLAPPSPLTVSAPAAPVAPLAAPPAQGAAAAQGAAPAPHLSPTPQTLPGPATPVAPASPGTPLT